MEHGQKKKTHFKHIVIGVGGIGSSALYWLSRVAGSDVLGIEQFDLQHSNGILLFFFTIDLLTRGTLNQRWLSGSFEDHPTSL